MENRVKELYAEERRTRMKIEDAIAAHGALEKELGTDEYMRQYREMALENGDKHWTTPIA